MLSETLISVLGFIDKCVHYIWNNKLYNSIILKLSDTRNFVRWLRCYTLSLTCQPKFIEYSEIWKDRNYVITTVLITKSTNRFIDLNPVIFAYFNVFDALITHFWLFKTISKHLLKSDYYLVIHSLFNDFSPLIRLFPVFYRFTLSFLAGFPMYSFIFTHF